MIFITSQNYREKEICLRMWFPIIYPQGYEDHRGAHACLPIYKETRNVDIWSAKKKSKSQ
jgi:hypothetical protein